MTNILLIDMSNAMATSGVDRYMECLVDGLTENPEQYNIHRITLVTDKNMLLHRSQKVAGCINHKIPLPEQSSEIIGQLFWMERYGRIVIDILEPYLSMFEGHTIVHIHTLNLIQLARAIKERLGDCTVVTHLHCIPWKNYYNSDRTKFNDLYDTYYNDSKEIDPKRFLTNNCEWDSYHASDYVVCVTQCASAFLQKAMGVKADKIRIIPNGIADFYSEDTPNRDTSQSSTTRLLFVGSLIRSKGLLFILEALRKVRAEGYDVALDIAGSGDNSLVALIDSKWSDVPTKILGRLTFDELSEYYKTTQIGIISSVQEQASYVALEMAMFGVPVITTAVDGLDEIFDDRLNSIKIATTFDKELGVDTDAMAKAIISLIEDKALAAELSLRVRELYLEKFRLATMIERTKELYQSITTN